MKTRNLFIAIASLSMIVTACAKQELAFDAASQGAKQTFKATFENYKTTFDDQTGAVAWAVGDAIKFIWAGGESPSDPLTADDIKDGEATFHGKPARTDSLYTVYPSSIVVDTYVSNEHMLVNFPDVQDGQFAHANISSSKYLNGHFVFQNVGALLKFAVPEGVARVVISGNGPNPLVAKVKVGFPEGIISYAGYVAGSGVNEITVNVDGAGTYYAAVIPENQQGLYVSMFNSSDELVGEKQTFKDIEITRGQVKLLGTLPETKLTDKYFIKPEACGTGDGSSWDNAADLAKFKEDYAKAGFDNMNVHIAAGTYLFEDQSGFALNQAKTLKFIGGYPAEATGESLNGRNPEANPTVFDGNHLGRILVVTKGSYTYDGITFQNAKRTSGDTGSALVMQGCGGQTVRNCKFLNNENTKAHGGALRIVASKDATVILENNLFEGNKAFGNGGVAYYSSGILHSKNNKYYRNQALKAGSDGKAVTEGGGGAYQIAAAVTATFEGDHFYGNKALKASSSAVYVGDGNSGTTSIAYDLRFHKCVFEANRADSRGAVRTVGSTGKVYYNACAFVRDTVQTVASAVQSNCKTVIHNCTFFANNNRVGSDASNIYYSTDALISNTSIRLGGDSAVGIRAVGGTESVIVNSIIYNALSGNDIAMTSGKTLYSYGHNVIGTAGTTPISGTGYVLENENHTDYTYCYNKDSQPWKLDPSYIGSPYWVLKWTEWPAPGKPEGYELCTPARVEAAIDAFDTATSMDAKVWLKELGYLNKDQRGTTRSSETIWPGSYDNSASSTLE